MSIFRYAAVLFVAAAIVNLGSAARAQLDPTDFTSLGALNVTSGTLTIDTDHLTISGSTISTISGAPALNQNGGPQIGVFDFSSINIGSSVSLTVKGSRALALLSPGNISILPTMTFVSSNGGLGGFQGGGVQQQGPGGDQENEAGFGPGGGYAFGRSAGGGGYGGLGGVTGGAAGGLTYGNLFQILQGGGGGGASANLGARANAVGGPGGGALEIVSSGNIALSTVHMNGTAGTSSNASNASGGGGAGGGILLSAGGTLTVSGTLDASGGNGAGFDAGGGGGGRIGLVINSYTFGGSTVTTNLNGGTSTGSGFPLFGAAGVLTLAPVSTTVTTGNTIALDGQTIIVTQGSVTQTAPTVEVYLRNDMVVNSGATVNWEIDNALEHLNSSGVNVTAVTLNGVANTNGYDQTVDTLAGTTGSLSISAGSTFTVGANNGTASYTGSISGAGTFVKEGSGAQTLGGSNTFSGSTMVTAGTLTASNNSALQNSTVTLAGGALTFSGINAPVIGALAGTSNLSVTGLATLNVGGNNNSTTYSGNLTGAIATEFDKTGTGTWTLSGTNTETALMKILGGTVLAGSATALSPNAPITISSMGTLDLGDYNYAVTSANVLTVNGTVRNGSISGAGSITLAAGGTFAGISTATSATVNETGAATVSNFTDNGQFTNAGGQTLSWSNSTVTSAGRLTVNGTVNSSDFISNGVVTINATGTISNSGSNLYLGGGSRTTVNTSGHLTTAAGTTIELNGGLLVNNGTISGTTDVNYGSLAKGTGTYGVVNVGQGGVYAPGNSPGIVTAAAVSFDSTPVNSGAATLQIELAGTTPGTEYDQLHVTGQLSLGGLLQVMLLPGFNPALGNSFDIMDWGTLRGKFSSISLPGLSSGLSWSTLQLYTTGTLQVTSSTLLPGDFNRDGHVDAADILAMQQALTDLHGYEQTHGGLSDSQVSTMGDLNNDGKFTNADLQTFLIDLKSGGGSADPVPEPAALLLGAVGGVLFQPVDYLVRNG